MDSSLKTLPGHPLIAKLGRGQKESMEMLAGLCSWFREQSMYKTIHSDVHMSVVYYRHMSKKRISIKKIDRTLMK